MSEVTERR